LFCFPDHQTIIWFAASKWLLGDYLLSKNYRNPLFLFRHEARLIIGMILSPNRLYCCVCTEMSPLSNAGILPIVWLETFHRAVWFSHSTTV
jgi:hypothetical protein